MFRIRPVFLLLPAFVFLQGAVSETYALNCSAQTVKAAVESGWEPSMIAAICPQYKATLATMEAKAKLDPEPEAPPAPRPQPPAPQVVAAPSAAPQTVQGCSDYDRADMVLVGVQREVILELCGDPRPLRRRTRMVPTAQPTPAPQAAEPPPAPVAPPEPAPKVMEPEPEPMPEPEPTPEPEPSEPETPSSTLEVKHRIGLGFGFHTGTHAYTGTSTALSGAQLFLPYYLYHFDENLLFGAQLRKLTLEGSGSNRTASYELLALTASAGYLWHWNDFLIGGQGFFGIGPAKFRYNTNNTDWPLVSSNDWLYGLEGWALYDLWDSLHVGATFYLAFSGVAFGGKEILYNNDTTA
ncbi:MAG: hypothetical protein OSB18_11425, partial [SAR324 cluster bacterium]|nr:hypothetical protein [SAR324 cluster bacterium]